ncbi:excinuclease ABC subunit UvrA [Flammeovirga kamogawensis]|uniref:UvrABC system protein A n=1 Tax=Flammeovirga kamogawensis TaxID=373891 RepID=A0ABX8GRN0_9BACT|nr:excinuclease ABC subunit UvrA [Flammeovirga kamogawensis]MBB6463199.1 excinuclease ABC subunit A [Flammeovirga kamogawensis]QWG05948.1 excinuclease ABC subunit UvrA [Flammeovirga kamogawensis]TRX67774.1 excinuclease ABC subunit A [Flammeovirga kamogawensis]
MRSVDQLNPKEYIIVKGARVNNLKNVDVSIPRNSFVVITGVSGSGKSSLAFDTLFAEGQRMYVESLSSYARQFLGRMEKPEVEYIRGICPAIAVEQKVSTKNPRSTVGTTTEIYDYLKLLYARIGKTYSPVSGKEVSKSNVTDIVNYIHDFDEGTRFIVSCPLALQEGRTLDVVLKLLLQQGFTRVIAKGETLFIEELLENIEKGEKFALEDLEMLIDRNAVKKGDEENQFRIADSVQTALFEGRGECRIQIVQKGKEPISHLFSDKFEADGILFEEPSVNLFSFNNPYGACKRCEGFGKVLGIDADLVIPDKSLSVLDDAIAPWRTETMKKWIKPLLDASHETGFPIFRSYQDLSEEEKNILWNGLGKFKGINAFFKHLESKTHKIQYRVMLSRYRGRTVCPECHGSRLRKDAAYVKINDKSIIDVVLMPIAEASEYFNQITLNKHDHEIADRLLAEIKNRLQYMNKVGLGYLTLNRLTSTLSGGEYQRIKLATSLGSALVGSMYILDEPSIGLHPRDTQNLIAVLLELKRLGNTVIVVEHEEEVMKAADEIIDIGPDAGSYGGELRFQGTLQDAIDHPEISHTTRYLSGKSSIPTPEVRRKWTEYIEVIGARENNLKNLNVKFPLGIVSCVTGVSGSGKSTLIKRCLTPAITRALGHHTDEKPKIDRIDGAIKAITKVEFVDQNPIGKSSRSNPVTYVKAYDAVRELFSKNELSVHRGYKPAFFSFNVDGGRCEACQGEGTSKIEMQFMADIFLPCESCKGKRFKNEILEVKYKEKSIADILDLSVDEAVSFFADQKKIIQRLQPLLDVGLGYVRLGQSSNTLSGGEAQRVKLASFLAKGTLKESERVLFIFDEPTTGLHFHDIDKLMKAINALVEKGHSAVIIEHNVEVIKTADWVIDIGPEGGKDGGTIVFEGTPEELIKNGKGYTAHYLKAAMTL